MAKSAKQVQAVATPVTKKPAEKKTEQLTAEKLQSAFEHVRVSAPHATHIYINVLGQFHLHPRNGFVKVAIPAVDETEVVEPEAETAPLVPVIPDLELPKDKPKDGLEF